MSKNSKFALWICTAILGVCFSEIVLEYLRLRSWGVDGIFILLTLYTLFILLYWYGWARKSKSTSMAVLPLLTIVFIALFALIISQDNVFNIIFTGSGFAIFLTVGLRLRGLPEYMA